MIDKDVCLKGGREDGTEAVDGMLYCDASPIQLPLSFLYNS
jgi:hypothetical protein